MQSGRNPMGEACNADTSIHPEGSGRDWQGIGDLRCTPMGFCHTDVQEHSLLHDNNHHGNGLLPEDRGASKQMEELIHRNRDLG